MPNHADDEYQVLTDPEAESLLAEVASIANPRPVDVSRWRRQFPPEQVAAAMRLSQARRKADSKFALASKMWLDPLGAEQATAEAVAHHKASRFPAPAMVVDLCSGIGGDALALGGKVSAVLAVDLDQGMARRLSWNARVHGRAAQILPVRGRAEQFPIPAGALIHIDPDRRAHGGQPRARNLEGYVPGAEFLASLARTALGGGIKLGPASDFEKLAAQIAGVETEVVSLRAECKEVTLWFGVMASGGCRRATTLPSGASWVGPDTQEGPLFTQGAEIRRWLLEPDPALLRSGLLAHFGASHGLDRLDSPWDWLTADERFDSPFLTAFEVEEVMPLDRKRIKRVLASRAVRVAEIKTRALGPEWRPEALRKQFAAIEGTESRSLILFGGPSTGRAILARRWTP